MNYLAFGKLAGDQIEELLREVQNHFLQVAPVL
jgi:hypothetical protein